MSFPGEFLSEEQFTCSICLDVFTNPVSTPCGHSFCSSCITSYWEGQGKSCFCPMCKESFRKRPELHINHTLREITEQFKRMAETTMSAPRGVPADLPTNPFSAVKPGGQLRLVELPSGLLPEMKSRFQRTSSSEPLDSPDAHSLPPAKTPVTKSWEEVVLTPDPTAGAVLRNVTRMVEEAQERLRRLSAIVIFDVILQGWFGRMAGNKSVGMRAVS